MDAKNFILQGRITSEQPLATCSKDLNEREGQKNKPMPVPSTITEKGKRLMFPATGLRGKIRRSARDVVRDEVSRITGIEKPFSLDQHYMLTLGGIKSVGAQERASVAHEADWRRKNPLLSVFGAGDAGALGFVQGRLSVGNAVCENAVNPVIFSGARTDDFYRDKSQVSWLSDEDVQTLILRAKGGKEQSTIKMQIKSLETEIKKARRAGDDDKVAALEAQKAELNTDKTSVKDATGTSDVSIGMPLAGWQAIPQGQTMTHKMYLMRSNKIELGLLLKSLGSIAQAPFVGAHYATGCGMISGFWDVYEADLNGKHLLGSVEMLPFEPLSLTGTLADMVSEFDAFMESKGWDFSEPTLG